MSIVDFHNHLMPDVDDGAQSLEQSCAGLTAMRNDGVSTVITTPHFTGSWTTDPQVREKQLGKLDRAWATLTDHVREHHPDLRIERGVEINLDTPEPDLSDARLRLGGGPFVLFEFPFFSVPPRSGDAIAALREQGCFPIVAHPERYSGFAADYSHAYEWRRRGGYLQVNGGSLLGRYGQDARTFARGLLERGWADFLCSDYHARGATLIADYRQLLEELDALEHAQLLTEVNPARVLMGQPPLPVPGLRLKPKLWDRVSGIFRTR